jgi:protocatechuate 3,4-dioxygenase beta subunit
VQDAVEQMRAATNDLRRDDPGAAAANGARAAEQLRKLGERPRGGRSEGDDRDGSGAQVEGVVLGPEDKPMAGAVVAFIPESTRESHYRSATTDHDGTFRVKGVPPGKYKLIAWEDIEPGAYRDPEFVKPLEGQAQALAFEENGQAKVTLKAIPSASR